jgi:hypothetical protein
LHLRKSSIWDLSKIHLFWRIGYVASVDLEYISDLFAEDVVEVARGEVERSNCVSRV